MVRNRGRVPAPVPPSDRRRPHCMPRFPCNDTPLKKYTQPSLETPKSKPNGRTQSDSKVSASLRAVVWGALWKSGGSPGGSDDRGVAQKTQNALDGSTVESRGGCDSRRRRRGGLGRGCVGRSGKGRGAVASALVEPGAPTPCHATPKSNQEGGSCRGIWMGGNAGGSPHPLVLAPGGCQRRWKGDKLNYPPEPSAQGPTLGLRSPSNPCTLQIGGKSEGCELTAVWRWQRVPWPRPPVPCPATDPRLHLAAIIPFAGPGGLGEGTQGRGTSHRSQGHLPALRKGRC